MCKPNYNVQCLNGHVGRAPAELIDACKRHEEQGYLDALVISSDDCPDCQEDRRIDERRASEYMF